MCVCPLNERRANHPSIHSLCSSLFLKTRILFFHNQPNMLCAANPQVYLQRETAGTRMSPPDMAGVVLALPRSRIGAQVVPRCSCDAFTPRSSFLRIPQNVIQPGRSRCSDVAFAPQTSFLRTLHPRSPRCSLEDANDDNDTSYDDLKAGSPVMIIEAPPYLKTAEPMPMMRPNGGAVMPGDAGRVIGRKPKDVWAIRVAAGAFLIERKYFKPLEVQ